MRLPTFFVLLRPAEDPVITHDAPAVWKQAFGARLVWSIHYLLARLTLDLCDLVSH